MNRLFSFALALGLITAGMATEVAPAMAQDTPRQTRSVDAFTKVAFAVPGTLYLRQGEPQSVEPEGPTQALDRIETVVENGQLKVRLPGQDGISGLFDWLTDGSGDTAPIDVYVTMPTVEGLSVAGTGDIVCETRIESEELSVEIAGSGGIQAELTAARLRANIAGSGDLALRGRADEVTVEVAGSGDVRAADLQVGTASISTAGSGDTELRVTDRLSARLVGSGDVRYRGRPTIETSIVGSGNVEPIEE